MERILILGSPGAGKSTAARRLARITGLPLIHLDAQYWSAGWREPERALWREKVAGLISGPRWIMDGNYGGTLDLRIPAADAVLHLDFSTALCLGRVLRRTLAGMAGAAARPDMAEGCPERFDPEFLRYVLRYRREGRLRVLEKTAGFAGDLRRFPTPRALEAWLKALELQAGRSSAAT